jgi:hypothetical protein
MPKYWLEANEQKKFMIFLRKRRKNQSVDAAGTK